MEAKLRKLRQSSSNLEEENALLSRHVDSMKSAVLKVQNEVPPYSGYIFRGCKRSRNDPLERFSCNSNLFAACMHVILNSWV